MSEFLQSSSFAIASTDALELLRYAPLVVKTNGTPVLHYVAPVGIWEGAPIHYHMLKGMILTSWRGTVVRSSTEGFVTKLMPTFAGPLQSFLAQHAFEQDGSTLVIRDQIEYVSDSDDFSKSFDAVQVTYRFDWRRWTARKDTEAVTTSFDVIGRSQAAG
jgi:hypothetical protein